MDEFSPLEPDAMSSNETPKDEPKLEVSAPSIVPAASNEKAAEPVAATGPVAATEPVVATEAVSATEPVAATEAVARSAAKSEFVEKLPEAPKLDGSSAPQPGRRAEPTIMLPALRTATASNEKAEKQYGPEIVMKPRSSARFGLLAACVAIAASFGAVAGSLSVAKLGPMFAPAPVPVVAVPAPKDNVADDVKALRDTVAQLRATTKSLSDNLAALKTAVSTSNTAQNGQIAKLTEALDRVEKGQAEQRRAAATPAATTTAAVAPRTAGTDVTGSIAARPQATQGQLPPFDPQASLRQSVVQGWVLRRVYDGAALIEGRDGIIEVEPGVVAPGLGRIEGIKRQDGRWVVVTSRGLVIGR
jgi:hypothetical protein